ncbi:MAG: hypothetical protein PWP31_832 [Clostridia bacterium]|nr:hypothetical protein [Clostridia bacterium]
MGGIINSNEQLIAKVNSVLKGKSNSIVNIINDKLTLSVFSELKENMKKVSYSSSWSGYSPCDNEIGLAVAKGQTSCREVVLDGLAKPQAISNNPGVQGICLGHICVDTFKPVNNLGVNYSNFCSQCC